MAKIIVYHEYYGCDTGCCGHTVRFGDDEKFAFSHPYGGDFREFAEGLIRETFGESHVKDLDWDNCLISDE